MLELGNEDVSQGQRFVCTDDMEMAGGWNMTCVGGQQGSGLTQKESCWLRGSGQKGGPGFGL